MRRGSSRRRDGAHDDQPATGRTALLAVAGAACVASPVTVLAGVHSPVRAAAALVLICLAPGAAVLPLLARRPVHIELALVVGMSLGACAVLSQAMLWLHAWRPAAATCALAAACLASIGAQLVGQRAGATPENG